MKVENFRTIEFRNIINHIATEKGYDEKSYNKIKYNIKANGDIKPLRINGADDNYIAWFRKDENNVSIPVGITYNDYISFNRDITLSKLVGEDVIIKDIRRVQKEPDFTPVVGMRIRESYLYGTSYIVIIEKVTSKQFKYSYSGEKVKTAKLNKQGYWFDGNSFFYNDVDKFDFIKERKEYEYDMMNR
jgi:hypothetical protein